MTIISQTRPLKNKIKGSIFYRKCLCGLRKKNSASHKSSQSKLLPVSPIPLVLFQKWKITTIILLYCIKKDKQNNQILVNRATAHWMNYLKSHPKFLLNRILKKTSSFLIDAVFAWDHCASIYACIHTHNLITTYFSSVKCMMFPVSLCANVQSSRETNARYFPVQMWTQSPFYFYLGNCEQIVPLELYALTSLSN